MTRTLFATSAIAALLIGPAAAQQQPTQQQTQQQQGDQQVAQQCLQDLQAQAQHMQQEGYWLAGWGQRWGGGPLTPATPMGGPATTGATGAPAGTTAEAPRPGAAGALDTGPWTVGTGASPFGVHSPRFQIRTLYAAGHVLANRGEEQACQTVLQELQAVYDDYAAQLQEAGVQPGEVTTWRQEQIAAAQPVTELQRRGILTIDEVTGTDVRNLQDEHLGSVDDVLLDPETGAVSYAIIARGGFLGIGEDYVAVPWERFSATPGLNTLVLNVPEATLEQAPEIDPDRFADPQVFTETRERTDAFWQQQQRG